MAMSKECKKERKGFHSEIRPILNQLQSLGLIKVKIK